MENLKDSLLLLFGGDYSAALWQYLLEGVMWTLICSLSAVIISLVFGAILAIVRNYCKGLRVLATVYIELFRNTPLMLWMFVGIVFFPAPSHFFGITMTTEYKLLFRVVIALTLFTSSIMAEVIRGGLNSINKGQFEAGYSQGFNFVQVLFYIVLPQTFKNVVPTMLSQVITTIKDSSYLANAGVTLEFMAKVKKLSTTAYLYTGNTTINVSDIIVLYSLALLIYFAINFTLSCVVRKMQKRAKLPASDKAATSWFKRRKIELTTVEHKI